MTESHAEMIDLLQDCFNNCPKSAQNSVMAMMNGFLTHPDKMMNLFSDEASSVISTAVLPILELALRAQRSQDIQCVAPAMRGWAMSVCQLVQGIMVNTLPVNAHDKTQSATEITAKINFIHERYEWVQFLAVLAERITDALRDHGDKVLPDLLLMFVGVMMPQIHKITGLPAYHKYPKETADVVRNVVAHALKRTDLAEIKLEEFMTNEMREYFAPVRIKYLLPGDRADRSDEERAAEAANDVHKARKRERRRRQAERRRQKKEEERHRVAVDAAVSAEVRNAERAIVAKDAEIERARQMIEDARLKMERATADRDRAVAEAEEARQRATRTGSGGDGGRECLLCMSARVEYVFMACGHGYCCRDCHDEMSDKWHDNGIAECATCRTPNHGPLKRVFV